jgi:hypothetical protein
MNARNTLEGAWAYRQNEIAARLLRENIANDKEEEIRRCLGDCCGAGMLIRLTLAAKEAGLFSWAWLEGKR